MNEYQKLLRECNRALSAYRNTWTKWKRSKGNGSRPRQLRLHRRMEREFFSWHDARYRLEAYPHGYYTWSKKAGNMRFEYTS